jgi:hypothetical protein
MKIWEFLTTLENSLFFGVRIFPVATATSPEREEESP